MKNCQDLFNGIRGRTGLIAACQTHVHRAAVKTYCSEVPMNDALAANSRNGQNYLKETLTSTNDIE